MPEQVLDLSVGETIRIGEYCVTLVDIDGEEVAFRIDPIDPARMPESGRLCAHPPGK